MKLGRARDQVLLLELALNDLLLFLLVLLVGAEDDFAVDRQGLQQKVEPIIIFVREAHADVQPIIVPALALDDGVRAVRRLLISEFLSLRFAMTPRVNSRAGREAPRLKARRGLVVIVIVGCWDYLHHTR